MDYMDNGCQYINGWLLEVIDIGTLCEVSQTSMVTEVAWLQVNTQTILTIAIHVITKNHRIAVSHSDHTWYLHIREVRESDQGDYMCQINTDPMISQVGHLKIVVPPDILDYPTSTDMVVREGSSVILRCAATGSPMPSITWKRETGELIPFGNNEEVSSVNGSILNITRVNRLHMGAYLCIASNGVPPTVSKRIMLIVHFPPMITVQNQLVGSQEGQIITLECHSEAFPKSINYWTRENNDIISSGDGKYEVSWSDNLHMDAYKTHMKLTIREVGPLDYGSYKCIAKNSLGSTDGTIKLYRIDTPTTQPQTTTTTPTPTVIKVEKKPRAKPKLLPTVASNFNEIIDASKSHDHENSGAQLRERPKTDAKSGRNRNSDKNDRLQPDKTAQSMSSKSAAILSFTSSHIGTFIIIIITLTKLL
ncbi:hypothetical protein PV328_008926 [Microctonus aethiopoides]|uniref:Ig-like domain-containing protein n=1 Tax=Microctonus aethiopoides TaxID=144406 RepID=A0AA39FKL5_9HYME|nr:hypothetical protein PV328_008926 [Microctonus aethiopoides]